MRTQTCIFIAAGAALLTACAGAGDDTLQQSESEADSLTGVRDTAEYEYEVSERSTRPIGIYIQYVGRRPQNSSLERRSIILNAPSSPVQIDSVSGRYVYQDNSFQFHADWTASATDTITAYEIRHSIYDVFGEHLENLSATTVEDIGSGGFEDDGAWRILNENEVLSHLTSVSYVANVRRSDGSTWTYDELSLLAALTSLNLEGRPDTAADDSESGTDEGRTNP